MNVILKGKIIKGVGGLYTVRVCAAESEFFGSHVKCRARGIFRHNHTTPLPGDNVLISYDDARMESEDGERFVIDEIVDRKNALIRPPLANLDYLFVTMACASPSPVLSTVDKLISIAEHNRIEPIIVITKCELDPKKAEELEAIYRTAGFECFRLSAKEDIALEPIDLFIKQNMAGKIAAFAGASGIGKSTLLNRLFPHLDLSTSAISRKIERGRHTTREAVLFEMSDAADCGYIADTPGFSMLDFKRFDFFEKDDLVDTMREFAPYVGSCRYTKCSHTKEEGCAVIEAVKRGEIPKTRHQSYVELYEILKTRKKWD